MTKRELQRTMRGCKTGNAVLRTLAKNGVQIVRNDSRECGCFSVWVTETLRVYKPIGVNAVSVQEWTKVNMSYSGTPTFFG